MRVIRTILGMLILTIGLPALIVGAGFWTVMQHRDAGGAFSGALQRVTTPGYAIVVDDLDALLREDAPFARVGGTRLRITANAPGGPAFIGIAPAAQVAGYLAGVPRATVHSVNIGTGTLPVVTRRVDGSQAPTTLPGTETFWTRAGAGALDWSPADLRGGAYSLVIMNRNAQPGLSLNATAELRPGWLNSSTWALLMLGSMLVMGGLIVLGWPGRRREIVYVVEPSQVPELMKTIGSPLPLARTGGRHAVANRPRTLADAQSKGGATGRPQLSWPPVRSAPASRSASPVSPAASSDSVSPVPVLSAGVEPDAALVASPAPDAGSTGAAPAGSRAGSVPPAPGEPLSLIASAAPRPASAAPAGGSAAPASAAVASGLIPTPGDAPSLATEAPSGRAPAERLGRRRAGAAPSGDAPIFEASAVEAWVAETAAARARETAARAAEKPQPAAEAKQPADRPNELSPSAKTAPGGVATEAAVVAAMGNNPKARSVTRTATVRDSTGAKAKEPQPRAVAPSTVVASSDDPDVKLTGSISAKRAAASAGRRTRPAAKSTPAKPTKARAGKATDAPRKADAARVDAAGVNTPAAGARVDAAAADAVGVDGGVDVAKLDAAEGDRGADVANLDAVGAGVGVDVAELDAAGGGMGADAAGASTPQPRSGQAPGAADEPTVEEEATPAGAERLVPSARQSGYQVEVAELLAGAAARRKRRAMTAAGLPAPDPAAQQPSITLTRPPRPGSTKPQAKD